MSQSIRINCDSTEGLADLLRLLVVNTDCTEYLDCDNKDDSIESIVKRLVSETEDGQLALNVCGCPEATDVVLTYQSIYIPWNQFLLNSSGATKIDSLPLFADCLCEQNPIYAGLMWATGDGVPANTIIVSAFLPRETLSGNIDIIPRFHWWVSAGFDNANIDFQWNAKISHHPVGEVISSCAISETAAITSGTACEHAAIQGGAVSLTGAAANDMLHLEVYPSWTTAPETTNYALLGLELIFVQNGTIGSNTI